MKEKIICPRCKGNGFIKVKASIDFLENDDKVIAQCTMCESQGEIENNLDYPQQWRKKGVI